MESGFCFTPSFRRLDLNLINRDVAEMIRSAQATSMVATGPTPPTIRVGSEGSSDEPGMTMTLGGGGMMGEEGGRKERVKESTAGAQRPRLPSGPCS